MDGPRVIKWKWKPFVKINNPRLTFIPGLGFNINKVSEDEIEVTFLFHKYM